jgi:hypothetical protein
VSHLSTLYEALSLSSSSSMLRVRAPTPIRRRSPSFHRVGSNCRVHPVARQRPRHVAHNHRCARPLRREAGGPGWRGGGCCAHARRGAADAAAAAAAAARARATERRARHLPTAATVEASNAARGVRRLPAAHARKLRPLRPLHPPSRRPRPVRAHRVSGGGLERWLGSEATSLLSLSRRRRRRRRRQ